MRPARPRKRDYRLLPAALLCAGALSCAWIRQVPDPENPNTPEYREAHKALYFEQTLVDGSTAQYEQLADKGALVLAKDSELHGQGSGSPEAVEQACLRQPVQLRFAWYSDVQLRQRDVKLFSRKTSEALDHVIPSFESDPVHEEFAWATYLVHLLALNRYQEALAKGNEPLLRFFIHTGDAIDAGTIEELYRFVYLSNRLEIPWLNLIGNHDYSIFGNYKDSDSYTVAAGVAFYPVGLQSNFLHMHGRDRQVSGFGPHLLPVPMAPGGGEFHTPSVKGVYAPQGNEREKLIPPTNCHGFDLQIPKKGPSETDCRVLPGYYAFDLDRGFDNNLNLKLRVIVLNTEEDSRFGAGSTVGEKQITWLRDMLHGAHDRTTLLFSHHRIDGLPQEAREALLSGQNGPIVAFTGHTHQSHVARFTSTSGRPIYELNSSALMVFPQVGRIVELRGQGQKGCLVSRAAWPQLLAPDLPALRPHALTGRQQSELASCDAKRLLVRKDLAAAVRCARLGALRDSLRTDEPAWGHRQDFEEAWDRMNVVIPLELAASEPLPAQN